MITEIGLGLWVVFAGLWSGLLLTLTTILHPMFVTADGGGSPPTSGASCPSPARRRPTTYW